MFRLWRSTIILLFLCFKVGDALRCRKCDGAASLDDCSQSVDCHPGEVCFIDEVVTSRLHIVYNGGCRPSVNCSKSLGQPVALLGRSLSRLSRDVLVCSECCDQDPVAFVECNSKLCSLRRGTVRSDQCYHCDSTDARGSQGDVLNPSLCTNLATCNESEHCGVETLVTNGTSMHRFTCLSRRKCTLLTQIHLQNMKRCQGHGDTVHCGNVVGRRRQATNVCTACCGDGLCNHGTCQQVLDRLYGMWENNVLNFQTLRVNGSEITLPTMGVPTTPASTMSPMTSQQTATTTPFMLIPTLPSIDVTPTKAEP